MKYILLTLFLCICQVLSDECKKTPGRNCECKTSTVKINLEQYAKMKFNDIKGSRDKSFYSYNPCVPIKVNAGSDWAAIWERTETNVTNAIGTFNDFEFQGDPEKNNLRIIYTTDKGTSNVKLECSRSNQPQFEALGQSGPGTKLYDFTFHTSLVCFGADTVTPGTPGTGSQGLSVGSILLIVFFVLVLVYIIGGMLYLRFAHGARGVEQIPNYDFWIEFPLLVRDGVVFVSRGCKPEPTYQQI